MLCLRQGRTTTATACDCLHAGRTPAPKAQKARVTGQAGWRMLRMRGGARVRARGGLALLKPLKSLLTHRRTQRKRRGGKDLACQSTPLVCHPSIPRPEHLRAPSARSVWQVSHLLYCYNQTYLLTGTNVQILRPEEQGERRSVQARSPWQVVQALNLLALLVQKCTY
jgi:hypothetical protein